jgi:long-chain acyl-CoA synthetase
MMFADLEARTNAIGHGVQEQWVNPGDHVALIATNRVEFLEVLIGVQRAGCVVSPLKSSWTADEIRFVLRDADTRLVVTDLPEAQHAAHLANVAVLNLSEGFDDWVASHDPGPLPRDRHGWRMSYTSGTTGQPKGVMRVRPAPPFCDAFIQSTYLAEWLQIPRDGAHLVVSQLFHGAPLTFALAALAQGTPLRLLARWDATQALGLLADTVASTVMVPSMLRELLALPAPLRDSFAAPELRTVVHGGEPCPRPVKEQVLSWLGPVMVEYFGFTEGAMTVVTTDEWLARPGTVGRPLPHQEVRILDDSGHPAPPRHEGRVFFAARAGGRSFQYRNDPAKTASAYVGDAFTAGDIGWVDEDGYLYITGRSADVIVSSGVNLYPAQVEAVLHDVSGIVDVAVVGAPDPIRGETPVAFVVLRQGCLVGEVLAAAERRARTRLAGYQRPRRYLVCESLPRDPTGKLLRSLLRDECWRDRTAFAAAAPVPEST